MLYRLYKLKKVQQQSQPWRGHLPSQEDISVSPPLCFLPAGLMWWEKQEMRHTPNQVVLLFSDIPSQRAAPGRDAMRRGAYPGGEDRVWQIPNHLQIPAAKATALAADEQQRAASSPTRAGSSSSVCLRVLQSCGPRRLAPLHSGRRPAVLAGSAPEHRWPRRAAPGPANQPQQQRKARGVGQHI